MTDFDNAGNGDKYYSNAELLFALTNFTSGNCAPAESGNGSCLNEKNGGQGIISTVSRPADLSGVLQELDDAKQKDYPDVLQSVSSTELKAFTLVSFWFQLLGNGKNDEGPNAITVVNTGGQPDPLYPDQTTAPNATSSFTYEEGQIYANVVNFKTGLSEKIDKNNKDGYVATFTTEFANVLSVSWYNKTSANIRVDCVKTSYDGGSDVYSKACGFEPTPPAVVPVPAAGLLLVGGLGALAAIRRRKAA